MAHHTNYHKSAVFFLVAFFVFLVFVSAFHHHHDGAVHSECSLCMAACQPADVACFDTLSEPVVASETHEPDEVRVFLSLVPCEKIYPRGPPR